MGQILQNLQKIGLGVFIFALLLAPFGLYRQIRTARASSSPVVDLSPTSTSLATEDLFSPVNAPIPTLITSPDGSDTGIRRLADLHTIIPERPRSEVVTYTVQAGDNLFKIADQVGLQPETVLWGNYNILRDNPQFLRPGQKLLILPVDGVYYQWAATDDLEKVAKFFKVKPDDILNWPGNGLVDDLTKKVKTPEIADGAWLVIPGGKRELRDWGPPPVTRKNAASAAYYGSGYCGKVYEGAVGIGSFVWPTVAKYLSGYDYSPSIHPGIDIAGAMGNAIYATDSGVVVYAGWSEYGYGNLIVLDHGNGWQSAYAHLSALNVGCGSSVSQGQVIGAVGSTGNSTGPHLHFELRNEIYGKVNPWDYLIK